MEPFIHRKIFFFLLCLFFCAPESAAMTGARLADMYITNSRDSLLLNLKVKGAFAGRIRQTVLSGVPTTFSFFIRLEENRTLWTDKELAGIVLIHTVKYNNMKKEFTIHRSWEENRPLSARSLDEAEKLMSEVANYPVISLDRLKKGVQYEISAKAKLSKVTLPFYLRYLPVTPPIAKFETEWHSIEFEY